MKKIVICYFTSIVVFVFIQGFIMCPVNETIGVFFVLGLVSVAFFIGLAFHDLFLRRPWAVLIIPAAVLALELLGLVSELFPSLNIEDLREEINQKINQGQP